MDASSPHAAGSTEIGHRPPGNVDRARPPVDRAYPPVDRARPPYGSGLRTLSLATAATFMIGLGLVFFYAPIEADQGFLQKIFYVHVPLAIVSLCGFVLGGLLAIQHLRTRDPRWDMRSYVAIHMSLILGLGVLITGSIWAKASWGHWWVWDEPTLVSFLIVFLLYATYQPLRFSIEDPERQSRYASVFAITAGAFVPLNFTAVRLSTGYVHPRVLGDTSNLPPKMALTFIVCLVAAGLLYATLCKYEMTAKHMRFQLRALRRQLTDDISAPSRSAAPSLAPLGGATGSAARRGAPSTATTALGRPGG
jgi:heme exporter protein C